MDVMKEYVNRNGDIVLAFMDGDTFKRSIYSGGAYGAVAAADNDERSGTPTIVGDSVNFVVADDALRFGAGINASTDLPAWHGYIPTRNRFADAVTITAGRYLDEQYRANYFGGAGRIMGMTLSVNDSDMTGRGIEAGTYHIFLSPVLDGYQRGFPEELEKTSTNAWSPIIYSGTKGSLDFVLARATADSDTFKRVTAIDVFVGIVSEARLASNVVEANFLERVDLNSDGNYFLELTANVGVTTANKIVINSYADWKTFDTPDFWVYDVTGEVNYRVTGETLDSPGAGQVTLTVTPNAAATGSTQIKFFSRWFDSGTGFYVYPLMYDNYYKLLGSEMYAYLNIPTGDLGLSDFRYKYGTWNGNRYWIGGMPTDKNFSYYSVTGAPDIIPSLNIIRHKQDVKGGVSIGDDFLVFTDIGVERIRIYDNANAVQDDEYLNVILTSHRSITKIDDDTIVFMSYNGPYIISGRRVIPIGIHLREWWLETFTKAQLEACVTGYNHKYNEVWFSFPTYTTAPYTTGIIFVFDINAWRAGPSLVSASSPDVPQFLSPWWRIKTDTAIYDLELNNQNVLLGAGLTKAVDFDSTGGAETVDTSYKLKLLQNALPGNKVWWDKLFLDYSTSDTVSANAYYDEGAATALTLNGAGQVYLRNISKTLEIEAVTAASTNSVEHKGAVITWTPLRKS
jgi:hypothetical protein